MTNTQTRLTEEEFTRIINRLNELIPKLSCPMCKSSGFTVADGYFNNPVQFKLPGVAFGGVTIPTIGIVCNHCGFVSQHALKTIDLLPQNLK